MTKIVLWALALICSAWGSPRLDPLVDTRKGLIRGLQASDGDYSMFMGIPYARVNESNPFGPSLSYPDFEEVFEAYDDTAICPQIEMSTQSIIGSLDCLHLNIYVPHKATTRNRLPVMVWIHGGAFQNGSAGRNRFGPKYLVRHDVILVTMNYRVGLHGFMCLNTPDVPGNQGLRDQLSALRWVKENIDAFGGDANEVTIFGESAGGVSVDFHLLSKQEKLFDKVILQSGTTLCPWVIVEPDREAPIKIAEHLGMETDNNADAVAFIATVDPKVLIAAASDLTLEFNPCVEKDFEDVERFVENHPINSAIPKVKDIPILAGYNNNEMLYNYENLLADNHKGLDIFRENLAKAFDVNAADLATPVRKFYIGDEDISDELKWALVDFDSDFIFNHPVHESLRKYLENRGKVYHYIFSYSGGRNYAKLRQNITEGGATHGDELGYLFDMSFMTETPSEDDQLMVDRITTMWTNFVKYGDPTPETSDLLPVKWIPITEDIVHYLDIDSEPTLKRRPFHDRMAFWDLFYEMNRKFLKGYEGDDVLVV